MGFYDSKGHYRNNGEGFYDAKGCYRNPGEGFYDAKGWYRNPGEGYYDYKGCYRQPGEQFYDAKGNLCSGEHMVIWAGIAAHNQRIEGEQSMAAGILFLIAVPVAIIFIAIGSIFEWVANHFYLLSISFLLLSVAVSAYIAFKFHAYKKTYQRTFSIIGNTMCFVTFILSFFFVVVPGSRESLVSSILVFIFSILFIAVPVFFNYFHGISILEFVVGIAVFCVFLIFLKNNYSTEEFKTILTLYGIG